MYMYIETCRYTETDFEQFLLDLCYMIMPFVYVINFWLSERRGERSKGGMTLFPHLGQTLWHIRAR